MALLRRNLRHCPKECRKSAYLSLVRSILDYGSIIYDPYRCGDIDKIERVQRQSARFITGDYKSREEGCVTRMLKDLQLQSLQDRRRSARLIFLYKVAEGLVPAFPPAQYLKPAKQRRHIKAKTFTDFNTTNIISDQIVNNTRGFHVKQCKSA